MKLPLSLRLFLFRKRVLRKFDFLKTFAQSRYFVIVVTAVLLLISMLTFGLVYVDNNTGIPPEPAIDSTSPYGQGTPADVPASPGSETGEFLVTFSDPQLEGAVRSAIGKPAGEEILSAELQEITFLYIGEMGITDLRGVGHCANLDALIAWGNSISDISPLSGLGDLKYLFLGNNQISDLSPLSGLDNLEELYVWHNQISDLSVISVLTGLTRLDISFNEISDFTPLEPLENLIWIYLEGNYISEDLSLSFLPDDIEIYPGTRQDPNLMRLIENHSD